MSTISPVAILPVMTAPAFTSAERFDLLVPLAASHGQCSPVSFTSSDKEGTTMLQSSIGRSLFGCFIMVCVLPGASLSQAQTVQFRTDLSGSNQVPPVESAASGTVTAIYDLSTKRLSWNGEYSGLSGPATAAHIHGPAATTANARLVVWISENTDQCSQGECRSKSDAKAPPLASPFQGSAILTDSQTADLMAGMYYANIHTDAHPRGEIRGQLTRSQSN